MEEVGTAHPTRGAGLEARTTQPETNTTRLDAGRFVDVIAKGGTLAGAAKAAGSKARTRAAAKQAGYQLLTRLRERGVIIERFNQAGVTLDRLAENIARRLDAQKVQRWCAEGVIVESAPEPDYAAQATAAAQYMRAIGLDKVPQEAAADPDPLAGLSNDELAALIGDERT